MRRSGAVEAIEEDAGPLGLAAKPVNSIERSNTLHRTYAPVNIEAVRGIDDARLKGHRRMRAEDKSGDLYQLRSQAMYQLLNPGALSD